MTCEPVQLFGSMACRYVVYDAVRDTFYVCIQVLAILLFPPNRASRISSITPAVNSTPELQVI